jgi:REP element-mobilizing transposase RayT
LGDARQGEVFLSDVGVIVAERWAGIAQHSAAVRLDEWVVMPNHLHGILHLEPSEVPEPAQTLGQIIGGFKAASSRRIWLAGHSGFRWQPRFYDQLIRDDESLFNLRRYILDNPHRWDADRYHPQR